MRETRDLTVRMEKRIGRKDSWDENKRNVPPADAPHKIDPEG